MRELYPDQLHLGKRNKRLRPVSGKMHELVSRIIAATPQQDTPVLVEDLAWYTEQMPKMELGIIAQWFPRVVAAVEAQRSKKV